MEFPDATTGLLRATGYKVIQISAHKKPLPDLPTSASQQPQITKYLGMTKTAYQYLSQIAGGKGYRHLGRLGQGLKDGPLRSQLPPPHYAQPNQPTVPPSPVSFKYVYRDRPYGIYNIVEMEQGINMLMPDKKDSDVVHGEDVNVLCGSLSAPIHLMTSYSPILDPELKDVMLTWFRDFCTPIEFYHELLQRYYATCP